MAYARLTDQDIAKLVDKMRSIMSKNPGASFAKCFEMAQDTVLPVNKRYRKTVLQQRTKWSKKLQQAIKNAGLWPGAPLQVEAPQPVEKPVVATVPAVVHAPVQTPLVQIPEPVDPLPGLISQVMERLFEDIWKRVTPEIDKQIKNRIEEILARTETTEIEPAGLVGEPGNDNVIHIIERSSMPLSLPRMFIIGLLPDQIVILRRKLADVKVEMRFWKNEAITKLTENAEWADEIIVMSKFVSHSTIHAVRNKGRAKIKYCNGAVSELERQIRFSLPKQVAA